METTPHSALFTVLLEDSFDGLAYCQMLLDDKGIPADFVYLQVNGNFETMTGLNDAVGKRVTDLIPNIRTENPELFSLYNNVASTGKPARFETHLSALNKWFLVSAYSPKREFFVSVLQDITVQKELEAKLEKAHKAAQNVLEDLSTEKAKLEKASAKEEAILLSVGDGLIGTDAYGVVTLINTAAEAMLGKKRTDVVGRKVSDVVFMEDEKGVFVPLEQRPVTKALAMGRVTTTITTMGPTFFYVHEDGVRFPVAITATPVLFEGNMIGVIEVFRDITKEKEMDKAKNEFVSLASHQLRTPTTAISWYAEMLLGGEVGTFNEKQTEYLKEIQHGNARMIDLVNALLNVSRIEMGTFAIRNEPTDIPALVNDVLEELKTQCHEKKLEITQEYEKDIPVIASEKKLVSIIFQNLLANAVAYTPSKGKVSVHITKTEVGVRVVIEDSGCGIPKEAQAKLYTKFFRADNARLVQTDGTGLGLYITKSLVEALGGSISFSSEENKGTTFSVDMPTVYEKAKT